MKGIIFLALIIVASSCSFHSRQSKLETAKNNAKQEKKAEEEKLKAQASIQVTSIVVEELSEVDKVLSKRINAKTFDNDMTIIEEANLYPELTCKSFRYSYDLLKNSGQGNWDITYKKALDNTRKGSESARRFDKKENYSNN